MYVSNLRSYVEAMGGELKIIASFPEGDVAITNFEDAELVRTASHYADASIE